MYISFKKWGLTASLNRVRRIIKKGDITSITTDKYHPTSPKISGERMEGFIETRFHTSFIELHELY